MNLFSAVCVSEADDPVVLELHAESLRLPTAAIEPVAPTLVHAPDPA